MWARYAPRYRGRKVVFFGRSLGSGLAASLAAQEQPDLTLLVSPYRSMAALAAYHYPWVPSALLRYKLRTDQVLARIERPVLLLHGDKDQLIPVSHSHELAAGAPGARVVTIAGAGHVDLHEFEDYLREVRRVLDTL